MEYVSDWVVSLRWWNWRLWLWWMGLSVLGTGIIGLTVPADPLFRFFLAGGIVGLGQWLVLRQRIPMLPGGAACWTMGSIMIIYVPAAVAALLIDTPTHASSSFIGTAYAVVAGIVGLVAGAMQRLALQDDRGQWIIVSFLAGMVGWPLGLHLASAAGGLSVGAVYGCIGDWAVSGAAVAWLAGRSQARVTMRRGQAKNGG